MKSQKNYTYIGCDVAKAKIDIDTGTHKFLIENNEEGFRALFEKLPKNATPMLVCEHTGIYDKAFGEAAFKAKIAFAKVDPKRVRHFAKSEGFRAKNDRIDARIIRCFAEQKRPAAQKPVSENDRALRQCRNAVSLLTKSNAMTKILLESTTDSLARKALLKSISDNEKQIERLEKQIEKLIRANPEKSALFDAFVQVYGVGAKTAAVLLTALPEIGTLPRTKISALVGVAPFDSQSGSRDGARHCTGGRISVRNALYMACVCAVRKTGSPLRALYLRLRLDKQKPFKKALVACMRKLLIHLNSIARQTRKNALA